jgi:hypothetical protein
MTFELKFIGPDLRDIDGASAEVIACTIWEDQWPMLGLAGLLDWRLAGRLSALAKSGFLCGTRDELLMVPGRPRLSYEKILLFGLGPHATFDDDVARGVLGHLITALDGLRVKRAVIELPGRNDGTLPAERAAELLMECAADPLDREEWTFVEAEEAERPMRMRVQQERHRRPRAGA